MASWPAKAAVARAKANGVRQRKNGSRVVRGSGALAREVWGRIADRRQVRFLARSDVSPGDGKLRCMATFLRRNGGSAAPRMPYESMSH